MDMKKSGNQIFPGIKWSLLLTLFKKYYILCFEGRRGIVFDLASLKNVDVRKKLVVGGKLKTFGQ
jgi:hypothetical protein